MIAPGDPVAIMESMKMEQTIESAVAGMVCFRRVAEAGSSTWTKICWELTDGDLRRQHRGAGRASSGQRTLGRWNSWSRLRWIDYNGHMTEWQYYKVFADAGENFLRAMGFTEDYRLQGYSFFSVEGHQRNLRECRVGTPIRVYTEMIGYDAAAAHLSVCGRCQPRHRAGDG